SRACRYSDGQARTAPARVPLLPCFFFSSRRRHTRFSRDWSSDVCSSDLLIKYYNDVGAAASNVTWIAPCRDVVSATVGGASRDGGGQCLDAEPTFRVPTMQFAPPPYPATR